MARPALAGREHRRHDCHAGALGHGGADSLEYSSQQERREVGGESCGRCAHHEDDAAKDIDALLADHVRQTSHGEQKGADGQGEADDHPLYAGQLDAQVVGNGRQRHNDAAVIDDRGKKPNRQRSEHQVFVAAAVAHVLKGINNLDAWSAWR